MFVAGHVRVDDGAFPWAAVTFHQFMHFGRLVMVQGSFRIRKDRLPFVVAAERNCVLSDELVGMQPRLD